MHTKKWYNFRKWFQSLVGFNFMPTQISWIFEFEFVDTCPTSTLQFSSSTLSLYLPHSSPSPRQKQFPNPLRSVGDLLCEAGFRLTSNKRRWSGDLSDTPIGDLELLVALDVLQAAHNFKHTLELTFKQQTFMIFLKNTLFLQIFFLKNIKKFTKDNPFMLNELQNTILK